MKKMAVLAVILIVMAMAVSAQFALADVDVVASAAAAQDQQQQQQQDQQQTQTVNAAGAGGIGGDAIGNVNISNPRQHIGVQPGPSGDFVGAPMAQAGNEKLFACNPFFQVVPVDRVKMGRKFGDSVDIYPQADLKRRKAEERPVSVINWSPELYVHASDQPLAFIVVTGEYGEPLEVVVTRALFEAMKIGSNRVAVWSREEKIAKNWGTSLGSGAGGAAIADPSGVAGALALGGLFGVTRAGHEMKWVVRTWALNDGPVEPPPGVDVCGAKPTPVAPAKVKSAVAPPAPAPAKKPDCDADVPVDPETIARSHDLKWPCPRSSWNNMQIWSWVGFAHFDRYKCAGRETDKEKASKAFERAEKNYREGQDIDAHPEASDLLVQIYLHWGEIGGEGMLQ